MAITFPLVTLADGALISKTFIDAVVDDINHLVDRPDGYANSSTTGQTATTASYTQLTNPTITVTPKRTGNMLILGTMVLQHSAGGQNANIRFDYNGAKGVNLNTTTIPTIATRIFVMDVVSVTANTAYTIKMEFNNSAGSGTMTATNGFGASLFAREIGA